MVCIKDYEAKNSSELSLKVGDLLFVQGTDGSGYAFGDLFGTKKEGW